MDLITVVLLAAAAAAALLLVLHLRLARRHEELDLKLQRLERAQKSDRVDARSRIEEATAAIEDFEQGLKPKIVSIEPRLVATERRLDEAASRLEEFGPRTDAASKRATDAASLVREAKQRIDAASTWAQRSQDRFAELEEAIKDAQNEARRIAKQMGPTHEGLARRISSLEGLVGEIEQQLSEVQARARSGSSDASAEKSVMAAMTRPDDGPRVVEAPRAAPTTDDLETRESADADDPHDEDLDPLPEQAAPVETAHPAAPAFTYEGEIDEPAAPGLKGLLLLVALLAGLTMLFHLLGVGQ